VQLTLSGVTGERSANRAEAQGKKFSFFAGL
jgi:hypothetical protein